MASPLSDQDVERIRAAIFAGRRLEAIGLYRECTGKDLIESKHFIDALERELRTTAGDQFTARPAATGCMVVGAAVFLVLFAALWVAFAVQEGWPQWSRMPGSKSTQGIVAQMVRGSEDEADFLVVDYQVEGQTFRIRHKAIFSPAPYAVGQAVPVRYPPDEPQDGFVDTFWESWLAPIFLGGVALVCVAVAVAILWFRARSTKRHGADSCSVRA